MCDFPYNPVAVIGKDTMQSLITAQVLRNAGIPTETYFSGSMKKQFARASRENFQALVILHEDGTYIKETTYGIKRKVEGDLTQSLMDAIRNWVPVTSYGEIN